MKQKDSSDSIRPFGQTTISSFLAKSSFAKLAPTVILSIEPEDKGLLANLDFRATFVLIKVERKEGKLGGVHVEICVSQDSTVLDCFLIKYNTCRSLEEGKQPKPLNQSIFKTSDSDLTKLSNRTIKVKKNAFSSIGSVRNNSKGEKEKENGNGVLSEAIFKQFNSSAVREDLLGREKDEDHDNSESPVSQREVEPRFDSSKRKNPFGNCF